MICYKCEHFCAKLSFDIFLAFADSNFLRNVIARETCINIVLNEMSEPSVLLHRTIHQTAHLPNRRSYNNLLPRLIWFTTFCRTISSRIHNRWRRPASHLCKSNKRDLLTRSRYIKIRYFLDRLWSWTLKRCDHFCKDQIAKLFLRLWKNKG